MTATATPMPMFTSVPDDLRELPQAVLWKYVTRDGTTTKVPYQANGKTASTTDPATWGAFEDVLAAYQKYPKHWSGIGSVFSPDDPFCGIDMDGCIDDTGKLKPWAQPIIATFGDTYMEVSPSGHGIKIWCKATLPGAGRSKKDDAGEGIEMYDRGRYFTVTGNAFNGAPSQIEDHQKDVEKLYALVAGSVGAPGTAERPKAKADLHDSKPIPEGARYEYLQSVAAQYRVKGMDREEIYAALAAINQRRCTPPKADSVLRELADWAAGLEPGKHGVFQMAASDRGGATAEQPSAHPDYLWNETGNADRLFHRHGDDLAHCEQRDGFMVWTGKVWVLDEFVLAERMAEEVMLAAYTDAGGIPDEKERALFLKFVGASLSRKGLENMAHLTKKKVRQVDATDFDTDPFLLNCSNGTVDLRRGALRPHRKADLLSKMIPFDFDPAAECPLFLRMMYRLMGDDTDASPTEIDTAARLVAYLQRLFGCAATGKPEKLLVVFYGATGNNGKSTLLSTISKALGDREYGTQINIDSLMADPRGGGLSNSVNSDLSDLQGTRFVFSSEVNKGQRLSLSRVKYLTGLTAVKARRLRENWIVFPPTWKIFLDCNDRPEISSHTDPIWNRVVCIPFTVTIPDAEIDTDLPGKLEAELPGILAWIVEGARQYTAHGFGVVPGEVHASTEEYRAESDRLKDFIEDCCNLNQYAWGSSVKLSQAYTDWCSKNGEHPLEPTGFWEQIKRKGCTPKRREIHGKDMRGWAGIEVKP
jgi:putative DNA primase/helicase